MSVRLLIFDMDDTLVASGDTWGQAERRLYRLLGHEFDPRIAETYKGYNAWDIARAIWDHLRPKEYTAHECGHLLRNYLMEAFQGHARAMPGADLLLSRLHGHFVLAVASGSPPEAIHVMLERFGWADDITLVVSSENVPHGKPEPDVFLETAAQAGCSPAETLVIEDSLNGVRAAKRAGMRCFAVPSSDDPRIRAEADRIFASLAEISVSDMKDVSLCQSR